MKESPEIVQLKALITDRYVDEKITELMKNKDYEDLDNQEKLKLLGLLASKKKMDFRAKA